MEKKNGPLQSDSANLSQAGKVTGHASDYPHRAVPGNPEALPQPLVVGIGASAGGLAALRSLVSSIPADSGLAYVIVVHLSPEHDSHLAELLQAHCPIPVQQVTDVVAVEANRGLCNSSRPQPEYH